MKLPSNAVGAVFGAVAAVRGAKPLHPRGVVLSARLRRHGSDVPWGVAWMDEPGEELGVVRLSRSAGLPPPLPDVLGLALRLRSQDGALTDVLLSTTGSGPGTRHLLVPRRRAIGPAYGSLVPFRGPRGPVHLGTLPARAPVLADAAAIAAASSAGPLILTLAAATPRGPWRPFAELELRARAGSDVDPDVAFDPILHPVPGLPMYDGIAQLRAVAYRRARAGRQSSPEALVTVPGASEPTGADAYLRAGHLSG